MRRIARATLITLGCLAALAAPARAGGGGGVCPPLKGERPAGIVFVSDACFAPATVHASTGQAVTWRLRDAYSPHTVTSGQDLFDSGDVEDLFTVRFNHPGTYRYACAYHPWMTGKVVVEGETAGGADAVTTLTPAADESDPRRLMADAEHRLATAITAVLREAQAEGSHPAAAGAGATGASPLAVWAGAAAVAAMVAWFVRGRRAPA